MGESAPPSPGRGPPSSGADRRPPTVYIPQQGDSVGHDGALSPVDEGPREGAACVYAGSDTGCDGPEPGSPTAHTPLVPPVSETEPEPEMTLEYECVATPGAPLVAVGSTPAQTLMGLPGVERGYPAAYLDGSLPALCTPLMETKSETCSYILPPTAGCSGAGGFDTKSETNSMYVPQCRFCHMSEDNGNPLTSPCRCSGTLQHIHHTCLMRWLEILTKKSRKPPRCELCHFQYHRHKKFKFQHWRFPRVSRQDKLLHIIFIVTLLMMVGCAVATVMSFLSDEGSLNHTPPGNNVELSAEEITTLSCGVLFFVSFFIAMSVQIKAKHTIYQLLVKFVTQNMEWEIDEYDKSKDTLYKDLYKGLPVYV